MPTTTEVHARDRNTIIASVVAGKTYRILAKGQWVDWHIKTDARGFPSPFYLKPFEHRRRLSTANWFALVGFISPVPLTDRGELNPAGSELLDLSTYVDGVHTWNCPESGSLHVFANDLPNAYRNNKGFISVSIHEDN